MRIEIPSQLERSLQILAEQQEMSVDQLCVTAFTAYLNAYAPEFSVSDQPENANVGFIVRFTNMILASAVDSSANRVALQKDGEEFVVITLDDDKNQELGRYPLYTMLSVRKRLVLMSWGDEWFDITHYGKVHCIRLISIEQERIILGIEQPDGRE